MVTVHGNYVQFRFFRPGAQSVQVAGDFNGWKEDGLRMIPTASGYWVAVLRLPEGSYRFRYLADGKWFADFAAFGIEYGPYGPDSVVRVLAPAPAEAARPLPDETEKKTHRGLPVLSFAGVAAVAAESAGEEPFQDRAA